MTEAPTDYLSPTAIGVGSWTIDPARSRVRIAHKTMWGMVTVKGSFTVVAGTGTVTPDHDITGMITVAASSIDTSNAKRDAHLRSADFLDAEAHHDIVVTVHSGTIRGDVLELSADLAVKSVREPVTLTAKLTDLTAETVTAVVTGLIDRDRFGVSWNKLGMMRGLTRVTVDAVFTRPAR